MENDYIIIDNNIKLKYIKNTIERIILLDYDTYWSNIVISYKDNDNPLKRSSNIQKTATFLEFRSRWSLWFESDYLGTYDTIPDTSHAEN